MQEKNLKNKCYKHFKAESPRNKHWLHGPLGFYKDFSYIAIKILPIGFSLFLLVESNTKVLPVNRLGLNIIKKKSLLASSHFKSTTAWYSTMSKTWTSTSTTTTKNELFFKYNYVQL